MYKISTNSLFDQAKLLHLTSCHSTNAICLQLAQQQAIEGTIVITDCQTAGQGQRGNVWEAEPGKNLTFSILFKPQLLPIKDQFYLTKLLSIALLEALLPLNIEKTSIKWPNDLYIGDKKVAGMLLQNGISGNQISYCVAGIGLNVNQIQFQHDKATSLQLVCQHEFNLSEILNSILSNINQYYPYLYTQRQWLDHHYLNSLYGYNVIRTFESNDTPFEGKIIGVDEIGKLQVETVISKEIRTFDIKEIQFK